MQKTRIVVVEDDVLIRKAQCGRLRKLGYEVVGSASTGDEAVAVARALHPDLVLMDIELGGSMDGIQAAAAIRSHLDVPIVYVTAYADEGILERAKPTDPFGYVVKPYGERELRTTIEMALYKDKAERRLRESEAQLKDFLDNANDLIQIVDTRGRIVYTNQGWRTALGYSEEESRGLSFFDVVHPDGMSHTQEIFQRVMAGETISNAEMIFKTKQGTAISVEGNVNCRYEHGRPVSARGIFRDITERKIWEAEIIKAKDQWERTFDAVPDLVMILDAGHRILRVNRATIERLRVTKEDALGRYCHEVFHGTDVPPDICPHRRLLTDGVEHNAELFEPRLGCAFHVSVSPFYDAEGKLWGAVHVARDITERKRQEERQKQLVEEIKQFAYIVSHDLRAPLANVRGFTRELTESLAAIEASLREAAESMPEETCLEILRILDDDVPEAIHFIDSSVSRMNRLVAGILQLSRIGYNELHMERLNMNDLVVETFKSFSHEMQTRGIEVVIGDLPEVTADYASMEHILGNLVSNAIKYLDPERAGKISVTGTRTGDETIYRIEDNGTGVEESDQERIFDIFRRAGRTDVPGEGMGLTYVRTLVRRHGGRIWCESEPGVGSAFSFTVPDVAPATGSCVLAKTLGADAG
ncbi:MAG: PAS domain S-box protein [Desulfomonilaceae bacterium]|nr:PAS domain S-box protein [Desulfomonilaceae bacterium]